jgi:thioredoxin reductase (NADPH)
LAKLSSEISFFLAFRKKTILSWEKKVLSLIISMKIGDFMYKAFVTKCIALSCFTALAFSNDHSDLLSDPDHTVVIIGGGVGALTSALYLSRSGIKAVVVEGSEPGGSLMQSPKVQNWPGECEISGADLIEKIHKQAEHNGVIFLQQEVTAVDFSQKPLKIYTKDISNPKKERVLTSSSCILATGSEPMRLNVAGEDKYWMKGVHSCATCDGALYKDKVVAVVGGGDAAIAEAEYLSCLAKKVYVVARKDVFKGLEKTREKALFTKNNVECLLESEVKQINGAEEKVCEIVLSQGQKTMMIPVDAVFVAIGSRPNTQLFNTQVMMDETGYVKINSDFETSISGVFAIGDVVDSQFQQAISAAGDGAKAAIKSYQHIKNSHSPMQMVGIEKNTILPVEPVARESFPDHVIEIKNLDHFNQEVAGSSIPVIVEFYASWCGPCRHLNPKLHAFAKDLQGRVKILKVNVNDDRDIASFYNVSSMPTMILIDSKGKVQERKTGVQEIVRYLTTLTP